jgi:colanic acid biosynthesis glycosyl transferase WcaI
LYVREHLSSEAGLGRITALLDEALDASGGSVVHNRPVIHRREAAGEPAGGSVTHTDKTG